MNTGPTEIKASIEEFKGPIIPIEYACQIWLELHKTREIDYRRVRIGALGTSHEKTNDQLLYEALTYRLLMSEEVVSVTVQDAAETK